ncbi:hypothetical protein ACFJIW_15620 [Tahibacter sp. UC22_41]|uniref:hypothetical protein n=1 Tax=Tahibacter sp. UC22_41 TaxID=3350178 RepID=UPI0036D8CDCB
MSRLRIVVGSVLIALATAVHAHDIDVGVTLPADALLPGWQAAAMEGKDALVPDRYWGPSLKALAPIRIYRHRVNVAVVLAETADEESGVYFVVAESSCLPVDSPGRSFHRRPGHDELGFTFSRQPAKR